MKKKRFQAQKEGTDLSSPQSSAGSEISSDALETELRSLKISRFHYERRGLYFQARFPQEVKRISGIQKHRTCNSALGWEEKGQWQH